MKKYKFLILFLSSIIITSLGAFGYHSASESIHDTDELTYTKGKFDYYQTKRKYKNRRKGSTPFRQYLIIYLEDDIARYKDGKFVLDNMEQNAVLMIYNKWPKDSIEIGYKETEDAGLRIMYDIKYQGTSYVNLEGVKSSAKNEATMFLIFIIICGSLSIVFLFKFLIHIKNNKLQE